MGQMKKVQYLIFYVFVLMKDVLKGNRLNNVSISSILLLFTTVSFHM